MRGQKNSSFAMRLSERDRDLLSAVAERESDRLGFRVSAANVLLKALVWYAKEHHPDLLEEPEDGAA